MNLISFSIKTKGAHNFARRLMTVFTRFGFSEARIRRSLHSTAASLQQYKAAPTFFIPAVVLQRHSALIAEIAHHGSEIGIHGYVHNDYRTLNINEQFEQTWRAVLAFQRSEISYQGFRSPYLGWTEESLDVFRTLDFAYESNEAVLHDVIDLDMLSPMLRSGYEKSLALFQAIPCNAYTLRPHFEGALLRIPTSIPDDEMLVDRLRKTKPKEVGRVWGKIMQRVYELGGIYTLNLHPERGILCKLALDILLDIARNQALPVWIARLGDIAQWWKERSQFRLNIEPLATDCWQVNAICSERATLLGRSLMVVNADTQAWFGHEIRVHGHSFIVKATTCPCIALSLHTSSEVTDFLQEQGYPVISCSLENAWIYSLYLDMPEGLGTTRAEQLQKRSALIERIELLDGPLLHFGCWPDGSRAALGVSGDIDSVTIQDFFMRIFEVYRHA